MNISAKIVKELRDLSGAGMMDCKKALIESNGDIEAAKELLRKKGLATASKKAGRIAAEGIVGISMNQGNDKAVLFELNAETDFVTRNEQFQALARNLQDSAQNYNGDLEQFLSSPLAGTDKSVTDAINEQIATIGENIMLRRMQEISAPKGVIAHYIHNKVAEGMGNIIVAVALETEKGSDEKVQQLGKHIAMHIAAANPQALNVESLSAEAIAKEKDFLTEQASGSGKPAAVIEKMIEGRMRKFYEEVVLLEQVSMLDGKLRISEIVAQTAKEVGSAISVIGFLRFEKGEGVEKKEDNFAEEVASMTGGK